MSCWQFVREQITANRELPAKCQPVHFTRGLNAVPDKPKSTWNKTTKAEVSAVVLSAERVGVDSAISNLKRAYQLKNNIDFGFVFVCRTLAYIFRKRKTFSKPGRVYASNRVYNCSTSLN
jgi:hypothetical protein